MALCSRDVHVVGYINHDLVVDRNLRGDVRMVDKNNLNSEHYNKQIK
jgi:hypothetical protein